MMDDIAPAVVEAALAMKGDDKSIDIFIMSDLLKGLVGHAQEMSMPVVDRLVGMLAEDVRTDEASALVLGGVSAWVPSTGSEWHSALVLSVPGPRGPLVTATLLERRGKPNPWLDDILEEAIAARQAEVASEPLPERTPLQVAEDDAESALFGGPDGYMSGSDPFGYKLDEVRTDVVHDLRKLDQKIATMVADDWSHDTLTSTSRSMIRREGWSEGHREGNFEDGWVVHFDALDRFARDVGIGGFVDDVVADYRARTFSSSSEGEPGLEQYVASFQAAAAFSRLDAGLPSIRAFEAVQSVQTLAMGMDLTSRRDMLMEIASMAEAAGHMDVVSSFDFNDLNMNVAVLPTGSEDVRCVYLRDQNCVHVARISEDGERVAVFSHRRGSIEGASYEIDRFPPTLQAALVGEEGAFAVFVNGKDGYVPLKPFEGDIEQVRSWNGFVVDIESAHCCLREEYDAAPKP